MKFKNAVLLFLFISSSAFSQNSINDGLSDKENLPEEKFLITENKSGTDNPDSAENNTERDKTAADYAELDKSITIDGKAVREIFELYGVQKDDFLKYWILNEEEKRLPEYKDSDEKLIAKIVMLNYVNKSRLKYKVKPLELDILASRVANRISKEAAENNFHGHWNMRGEKPYHRYAFAGGADHVSENASAYSYSAEIKNTFKNKINLMKGAHKRFMAEKAPYDGHKMNIIEKDHNYTGLGFHLDKREFRYYEEYINRYLDIKTEADEISLNEEAHFSFKPLVEDLYPYAVVVYREAPLKKMTASQINRKGSYPDYSNDQYAAFWPWDLKTADNEGYTHVSFRAGKSGLYYVHVYLSRKAYSKGRSASVRGKTRASGIVFQVR